MPASPFVLFIDDSDQELAVHELASLGAHAAYRHPQDVTFDDLERATLILVDEYLELWPERDAHIDHPTQFVRDGIGLAAILRSHLDGRGGAHRSDPTPSRTAIALRTGELDRLAAGVPGAIRPITVAARHDLEWVFEKDTARPEDFVALAAAASDLPSHWDPTIPQDQLRWLGLEPIHAWSARAVAQIERCRPPWSQLATAEAGRPWLSWFLQKILPYSTFLIDDARAAALLGLEINSFEQIAAHPSALASRLTPLQYSGHLREISGRRWWRAGIQHLRGALLGESTEKTNQGLAATVSLLTGENLLAIECEDPVFVIDDQYRVSRDPVSSTEAVRLQPDGWPVYADPAWLASADADDYPTLRALVILDDRDLLDLE